MASNASLFRRMNRAETDMLSRVMPRTIEWEEAHPEPKPERRVAPLTVTLRELAQGESL